MLQYRRRLPHYLPNGKYIFLTWRLAGSNTAVRAFIRYPSPGHAFVAGDRLLDRASTGPLWLKDPRIADLVATTIRAGETEKHFYDLISWVIMPNHVHMLILPKVKLATITRWLKGSTARW